MSLPVTLILLVVAFAGAWLAMQTRATAKDATSGLIAGFVIAAVVAIAADINDPNSLLSIGLGALAALVAPTLVTLLIRLFRSGRRRLTR